VLTNLGSVREGGTDGNWRDILWVMGMAHDQPDMGRSIPFGRDTRKNMSRKKGKSWSTSWNNNGVDQNRQ